MGIHLARNARKHAATGLDAQMLLGIAACVHSGGNLANATLIGHSLGVRHAHCVSRLVEASSQGIRVVFGLDPRMALPGPALASGDLSRRVVMVVQESQAVPMSRVLAPCFDCAVQLQDIFRNSWQGDGAMMARRALESASPEV